VTQPSDPNIEPTQPADIAPPPTGSPVAASAPGGGPAYLPPAPAAGAVATGRYFDPASGLNLPDGTELASQGRRIGAYFLTIPLVIVTLVIGYLIWGAIIWARGQTPALQVLGMRCWLPETGTVPGWWRMALREIVGRFLEGILLVTEVISFVLMLSRPDRRCIHDLVAGTVVLRDPNKVLER
jgi:uncharacterized RDD family membrane protein YckC